MIWIQQTNAKMFGGEYEHFSNIKILLFKHFSILANKIQNVDWCKGAVNDTISEFLLSTPDNSNAKPIVLL